jgi:hypothetical protein
VALAAVFPEIRNLGQDLDQWARVWYHRCSSIKAFWLMCGRNLPVLLHLGQNALSLQYILLSTTPPKTE